MNDFKRWRASALALLLLFCPGQAYSQLAPVGSPIFAGGATSWAKTADTGFDSTHNVFLIAQSEHQAGRVLGSFLGSDGSAASGAFRIDSTGAFPFGPAVAYSPQADVFLVVWVNETGGVRGRLVRYGSNALGAADFSVGTGGRPSWAPAIAYSSTSEEFLVSWSTSAGPNKIVRVSTAGAPIGSALQVTGAVWTQEPALAWNPANDEFFLVYAQEINPGWHVKGQRISQGQMVGGAITVHAAGSTKVPDVAYSTASGKFLVSWFQGSPWGVYGKLLNADGSAASAAQPLLPSNYGSYDANSLAYNSFTQTFGLASLTGHNGLDTIGGTSISSAGAVGAAARWVDAPAGTGNRRYPEIAASNSSDRFVVVFNKSQANFFAQKLEPGTGPPPPPPPPPPPGTVNLSALNASPAPPVVAGTPIQWTGVASGGTIEYQFHLYNGNTSAWTMVRDWNTSASYTQTPSAAGTYAVQVWARLQGTTAFQYKSSGYFNVTGTPPPPAGSLNLTSLTASPSLPRAANTLITWTGNASVGGGGTAEYQFHLYNGNTNAWTMARDWASGNTWQWTPTAAGQYAVQVWARLVGQTAFQYKSSGYFNITQPVGPTPSLTLVGIGADPVPPMVGSGTPVLWSGIANVGGGAAVEYQFWLYTGSTNSWAMTRNWGTGNTWQWTPGPAGTYAVQVWARIVGQTAFQYASSGYFNVTATPADAPLVNISSVTSTSQTFTAGTPVGWITVASGPGTLQYSYWVYSQATDTWTNVRPYATSGTYVWTPPAAGTYAVQVWVRRAGMTLAYEDFHATGYFTVN